MRGRLQLGILVVSYHPIDTGLRAYCLGVDHYSISLIHNRHEGLTSRMSL